jgi:membrane-associated protease RseP (regulator of RpoE activity)
MVNWDIVSIIVFYSILFIFFLKHRNKFTIQAKIFALYKTKIGIKLMDKIAGIWPRALKFIARIGVYIGFLGMAFILYFLIKETIKLIFVPGTPPALAPVLPGISIPGAPTLSFWHWVITIFIAATIHEFSHGVVARLNKIPVKSSGFAFLGPILAAFVEPEEKSLQKKKQIDQMSVFAAGPFSNIVLGIVILLFLSFILAPTVGNLYNGTGIDVQEVVDGYPMAGVDIEAPFLITQINGQDSLNTVQFSDAIGKIVPGDTVTLLTDKGEYSVVATFNPDDESKGFIGISGLTQQTELKEQYAGLDWLSSILQWFQLLFIWLFIINIGIGLFNLLPLGPVDGGRMFYSLALVVFKNKAKANKALGIMSLIVLALIVIQLIPWLSKLFSWVWGGLLLLIALLI